MAVSNLSCKDEGRINTSHDSTTLNNPYVGERRVPVLLRYYIDARPHSACSYDVAVHVPSTGL